MRRNDLLWGLVDIALLIILAYMLQGCTRVVYKDAPVPYVVVSDTLFDTCDGVHLCTLAQMICSEDNRPVVLVRKSHYTDTGIVFTRAHEDRHVSDMRKDCKKTQKDYKDSLAVRVRMESEAYCAEGRARLKAYKDVALVSSWFANMMQALFEMDSIVCVLKPP